MIAKKLLLLGRHYKDKCKNLAYALLVFILINLITGTIFLILTTLLYLFGKYSPLANTFYEIENNKLIVPCDYSYKMCNMMGIPTFILVISIIILVAVYIIPEQKHNDRRATFILVAFIFFIYSIFYNIRYIGYFFEINNLISHG